MDRKKRLKANYGLSVEDVETIPLTDTEHLTGARLRTTVDRIRLAADAYSVVKFSPDAALAVAELIEKLATAAGIELPESADRKP